MQTTPLPSHLPTTYEAMHADVFSQVLMQMNTEHGPPKTYLERVQRIGYALEAAKERIEPLNLPREISRPMLSDTSSETATETSA